MALQVLQNEMGNKRNLEESGSKLFDKRRMALNVDDVAYAIGRTKKAIYTLIERRQIPARKVAGRWVFLPEELEKWLRKGKATYGKL